jgi:CheY-like chemotaxis protein/HPt (histidine-containing phosphotransfer) domain-containing protein
MLHILGCDVELAEDGLEAVAKSKERSYDIILMDCQMPNMDGFSATGAIRALEKDRKVAEPVPIIAVTANALPTDRERCLDAGMSDYVSKPFRMADLKEAIERWLPAEKPTIALSHDVVTTAIGVSELDELREFGASRAELGEIVACYIDSSIASVEDMNDAMKAEDRESLRSIAHKLKGGSGQVGARKVSSICETLQNDAAHAGWSDLATMLVNLKQEINAANEELDGLYGTENEKDIHYRR